MVWLLLLLLLLLLMMIITVAILFQTPARRHTIHKNNGLRYRSRHASFGVVVGLGRRQQRRQQWDHGANVGGLPARRRLQVVEPSSSCPDAASICGLDPGIPMDTTHHLNRENGCDHGDDDDTWVRRRSADDAQHIATT